jgi:Uma2 family endonuclease
MTTSVASPQTVLQAKLQAWVVTLLTIVADAYEYGAVIGKGAIIRPKAGETLMPDVIFVPKECAKQVHADHIESNAVALAVDVVHSGVSAVERQTLKQHYANAHVLEYWQIDADKARASLFQASADWQYDEIAPDKGGLHYSVVMEELAFPVKWFKQMPDLWTMMEWWGMISKDE